jgi:hypothetical protein
MAKTMEAPLFTEAESTLQRLTRLIEKYHTPVPPQARVSAMVPDLDLLSEDINAEWSFTGDLAYRHGEIRDDWTVFFLSGDIDNRVAAGANP